MNKVNDLVNNSTKEVILLGYSMGARVALAYAVEYSNKLAGLVLVGGSPGISEEKERNVRVTEDEVLANYIMEHGAEAFINHWRKKPLIATQDNITRDVLVDMQKNRMTNTAMGLAESLRGMGTGVMSSYWDCLENIDCETMIVTGSEDIRFREIGDCMSQKIKRGSHKVIDGVGHAAHLEGIDMFCQIFKEMPFERRYVFNDEDLRKMVGKEGLEPSTFGLEDRCSIH